jgi:hypothetical protein
MRKSIFKTIPVLTVASLILVPGLLPSAQAAGCKNNDFKGHYGYSEQGKAPDTDSSGMPVEVEAVEAGIISADGKGGFTGNGTLNIHISALAALGLPGPFSVSLSGTYTVNSNCMGEATFNTTLLYPDGTTPILPTPLVKHYNLILNAGDEVRFISTDPGYYLVGVGRKVAAP